MVRFPGWPASESTESALSVLSLPAEPSRARPGRWQDRLIRAHGSRPGPASGRAYPASSGATSTVVVSTSVVWLAGSGGGRGGLLGGFDFRLSGSGAIARLRLRRSGRLAGPPGGGRKPAGLHREREASESRWCGIPGPQKAALNCSRSPSFNLMNSRFPNGLLYIRVSTAYPSTPQWVAQRTARGGRLDHDSDCRTTGSRATTGSPPRGLRHWQVPAASGRRAGQ